MSAQNGTARLRVLIATHRPEHLARLAAVIERLGHEIVAEELVVRDVGADTARTRPDVALVGVGDDPEHALDLSSAIVREAFCPITALIPDYDADWIEEAARRSPGPARPRLTWSCELLSGSYFPASLSAPPGARHTSRQPEGERT